MRKPALVFLLLTVTATIVFTQTKSAPAPAEPNAEQAVVQLTNDWLAAEERHDRAALRRIIADDFQGTGPMGNTVFKEEVIPEEGSQSGLSITASDMKARVFGDTAVVTAHGVSKSGEKGELRFTVVFTKRDNRWQMVAAHLSAVPK